MSIMIGNHTFEGPFATLANLQNASGVYAVLTRNSSNDNYDVVDIGESDTVRDRVANHDRRDSWARCRKASGLAVAVLYCGETMRMAVEPLLRDTYNPPCGDR